MNASENTLQDVWKVIGILSAVILLLISIPALSYYYNFYTYNISAKPENWGVFGDFLSGTIGTTLGLFAVIVSFVTLYYSVRTNWEMKKLNIEILQAQNTPLPYINLEKSDTFFKVTIQNQGLGPLIIEKTYFIKNVNDVNQKEDLQKLLNENENFRNSIELFEAKFSQLSSKGISVLANSAPTHIIGAGAEKVFLHIDMYEVEASNKDVFDSVISELKYFAIYVVYKDIFNQEDFRVANFNYLGKQNL